mgnify:CR=1 FL=1
MKNKLVLAFGAHPDDVEFGCGGTLLLLKKLGYKIKIVDLTRGEKSKRGASERLKEAEVARKIMGVEREILNFGDKKISLSEEHKKEVQIIINKNNPSLVFAPYFIDNHPDHVNTAKLVSEAFDETIHYFISNIEKENLGVDITKVYSQKIKVLNAHKTQIKSEDMEWVEERNKSSEKKLGVKYGELFYIKRKLNLPKIFKKL